ncbi:hypothetical protein [Azotobacter vinelandii]|uniref:hypothetical protein n=1 Tax=Azotobacter vinelandii TaxID=354 RepID=UPI00077484E0|nr:hypothetical protein [Azotobacter vinelandii]WKN22418.1 hypothetical protein AVAEIV_000390 [Azotobacter vinelandii]
MKAEHLHLLADISSRPTATARTRLIAIRRLCRAFTQELEAIDAERRALRRQAGRLRVFLPFTGLAVSDLERQASACRRDARHDLRRALASFGRRLMRERQGISETLGFDDLCDLLNVNPVHRGALCRRTGAGFAEIVFIEGLEDSAEHQGRDWKDGPLFNACYYAMIGLLRERGLPPDFGRCCTKLRGAGGEAGRALPY